MGANIHHATGSPISSRVTQRRLCFRDQTKGRDNVNLMQRVPNGRRGGGQIGVWNDTAYSRVVHQNIKASPSRNRLSHKAHPISFVGQIGLHIGRQSQLIHQCVSGFDGISRMQYDGETISG